MLWHGSRFWIVTLITGSGLLHKACVLSCYTDPSFDLVTLITGLVSLHGSRFSLFALTTGYVLLYSFSFCHNASCVFVTMAADFFLVTLTEVSVFSHCSSFNFVTWCSSLILVTNTQVLYYSMAPDFVLLHWPPSCYFSFSLFTQIPGCILLHDSRFSLLTLLPVSVLLHKAQILFC